MKKAPVVAVLGSLAVCGLLLIGCGQQQTVSATGGAGGAGNGGGIAPEKVVDFIHTVIESDRTVYADRVVQRLQNEEGVIRAEEHFDELKALPLPAQMLRMGAQLASEDGAFRYALISKWAINKANSPKTDFENRGLDAILENPDEPYTSYETVNGKRYFMAVYPDKAVSQACVTCHNEHPETPKTDFALDDVMGGIVITLPLD